CKCFAVSTYICLHVVTSSVKLTGDGSDVTQTSIIWKNQGEKATINCSHTKDVSHNQMYWYRQRPGETMKLIVFTTTVKTDHDFGDFSQEKFSATKPDAYSGTFTVKNLEPKDKVYLCTIYFSEGVFCLFVCFK
uniref:Immunoglobulin V-set domain-containing protein n=1 Tax=Amphilophus citrinellus TaxID=61819 RepID=A0A3Q0SUK8_AMPCI